MKGKAILVTVVSLTILAAGAGLVQAHGGWGRGMMGYDRGYGPGGYGCEGPRYGDCDSGGRRWEDRRALDANITMEEARHLVESRVSRNPYLTLGEVTENEDGYEVQVVTKKGGELVNRIQVEKNTGRVYRIFE
ncbi:MAG: hypothetical protein JSV26_03110 [bacterium]|nr:MAG: hypothetical protein JSV26_03110 [bacterium]